MNHPVKFGNGYGLQVSSAPKTQPGLLRLDNANLELSGCIEKRPGAREVPRTTTTSPNDEIDGSRVRAVWYREGEPILETDGSIYSRRDCAGDADVDLGTATPLEISDTAAASALRRQTSYDMLVPLSGAPPTADANARLTRDADETLDPKVFDNGSVIVTGTLVFGQGQWIINFTGGFVGFQLFPVGFQRGTFYQQDLLTARITLARDTGPGVCEVLVFRVNLTVADAMVINTEQTIANVQGNALNPAFEADSVGFMGLIEEPPNALLRLKAYEYVGNGGTFRTYELSAGDDTIMRSGIDSSRGFVYDSHMILVATDGPVASFVPLTGTGTNTVFVYDLPNFTQSGQVAEQVPGLTTFAASPDPLTGDRVGLGFDGADIVVAFDLATTPSTFWSILGPAPYLFNDVSAGSLLQRYDIDSGALQARPVVNLDELLPSTLEATAQIDIEALQQADGTHIVGVLDASGTMTTFIYPTPGLLVAKPGDTFLDVLSFDLAVESAFGWFVVGRLTVTGGVTMHVLRRSSDLAFWMDTMITVPDITLGTVGCGMCVTVIDDGGVDVIYRVTNYNNETASANFRVLRSYLYETSAGAETVIRNDRVSFVSNLGASVTHLELGASPRLLCDVFDLSPVTASEQIFEADTSLFVRVSPATVALAGGNWTRRGAWTRGVLDTTTSSNWGGRSVRHTAAASVVSPSSGGMCVLQFQELENPGSLEALVYSTHTESGGPASPVVIDVLGQTPHVNTLDQNTAAYVFSDNAAALQYQFWSPGESFVIAPVGITLDTAISRAFDSDGGRYQVQPFHVISAWADIGGASELVTQIRGFDEAVIITISEDFAPFVPHAVAVYAIDDIEAPLPVVIIAAWGLDGTKLSVNVQAREATTPFSTVLWARTFTATMTPDTPIAVTVGAKLVDYRTDGQVSVEYLEDSTSQYVIETYAVNAGSDSLIHTQRRASIHGSTREVGGELVHVESTVDFVSEPLLRNGLFLVAPATGEIVGRWGVASAGGGTSSETYPQRSDRNSQVQDLNFLNGTTTYGFQLDSGRVVTGSLDVTQFALMDFVRVGSRPAVIAGVAAMAMCGYPRAYDGEAPFEHDWHELPSLGTPAGTGGLIGPGTFGLALSYGWVDVAGNRYLSAPSFSTFTLPGPGTAGFSIPVATLSRTERGSPLIYAWRTLADSSVYRLSGTFDAIGAPGADTVTVFFASSDAQISANEILEQTASGVRTSQPTRVTEWMATMDDGRFWSRDYERDYLARFTIPTSEGNAPHWNPVQGLEVGTSAPIRAAGAMDGRHILWTPAEAHYFSGPGPDATGAGAYPIPTRVPSEIGCDNHNTVALTQDGLVFGSPTGPQILSRGMSVLDFSAVFYKPYRDDGETLSVIIYDPLTSTTYIGNCANRVFRWNHSTIRAAEDTGRPTIDASVSRSGEVTYLINDGRVLVQAPPVNVSSPRTDGPIAYELAVSTSLIRIATRDGNAMSMSNMGQLLVTGQWRGPHSLYLDIYRDYGNTPTETLYVPEATITERENAGLPYLYVFKANAVASSPIRAVLRDGAAPGPSFLLEQIDIHLENAGGERQLGVTYFENVPA